MSMPDYQKMYTTLFKAQTAAIELQEQSTLMLKVAQQKTEEMYISALDDEDGTEED